MSTRPKDIIDLDGVPEEFWRPQENCVHIYKGKLWNLENHGCVLCINESEDHYKAKTLSLVEDANKSFVCLTHGELTPVDYVIEQRFSVRIGDIRKESVKTKHDVILFPSSMDVKTRNEIVEQILTPPTDEEMNDESEDD